MSLTRRRVARRIAVLAGGVVLSLTASGLVTTQARADDPAGTDLQGTQQLVMSRVRTFSVLATPETNWVSQNAFNVVAATDLTLGGGLQSSPDDDGASYIWLSRRHPGYDFSDSNFNASWQYNAAYGKINWGAQLSSSLRGMASSPVTERTYWWVNNGRASPGSYHVQSPYYHFHGTISNVGAGDTVDFASEYTFECHGGRATCIATLYASFYVVD